MKFKVNYNYEESGTVIVEAENAQEAKELVEKNLEMDGLEAYPDRSQYDREIVTDTEVD
jgi:hypothetical protein